MATTLRKTAAKQTNARSVDSEELAELVKLAVAEAIREAIPKFVDDVVAQLSAKTQALVAEQMAEFRSEIVAMRADTSKCMEVMETSENRLGEVDSRLCICKQANCPMCQSGGQGH